MYQRTPVTTANVADVRVCGIHVEHKGNWRNYSHSEISVAGGVDEMEEEELTLRLCAKARLDFLEADKGCNECHARPLRMEPTFR